MDTHGIPVLGSAKRIRTETGYISVPVNEPSVGDILYIQAEPHPGLFTSEWAPVPSTSISTEYWETTTLPVNVSLAVAPTTGQVLVSTDATHAVWGNAGRADVSTTTESLKTATGSVTISSSTAPTAGQTLVATSATSASWADPVSQLLRLHQTSMVSTQSGHLSNYFTGSGKYNKINWRYLNSTAINGLYRVQAWVGVVDYALSGAAISNIGKITITDASNAIPPPQSNNNAPVYSQCTGLCSYDDNWQLSSSIRGTIVGLVSRSQSSSAWYLLSYISTWPSANDQIKVSWLWEYDTDTAPT